jgi:hypothetical protein
MAFNHEWQHRFMEDEMKIREILERVPDPRGRQGREYALWSILALIVVSMLCGRQGCAAAFRLGRSLTREQRKQLGFYRATPCHGTLTETLRVLDAIVMAEVLGEWADGEGPADLGEPGDENHLAIDGKTLRASACGDEAATHVLAAFSVGLRRVVGATASAGKGMEIPDALALLERLDLADKVVTGDAMFCQKNICALIAERGGDYVFPVKDNQPNLKKDIETAFNEPVFPPEVI